MHLGFDLSWTHLEGRWRLPGSWSGVTFPDVRLYEEIALLAERGLIDFIFFGDGTGIPSTWQGSPDAAVKWGIGWPRQDMSPYIALMSRLTRHVGFGLTYSSTFMHPFYVARLLNSLDHVTGGRMAFNVITSTRRADAANYGFDELMDHDLRYERMEEFIAVCKALWDSVAPDAFVWDRETGIVADTAKVRPIDHVGRFFKVKGPLASVPSPQGRPVLIQAGASPRGIRASAQIADHVFAMSPGLERQTRHRAVLDQALADQGRNPQGVGILWDVVLIVAETEAEAKRRREQLLTVVPPEAVGAFLSHQIGYDLSKLPAQFTILGINEEITAGQASPVAFLNMTRHLDPQATMSREEFYDVLLRRTASYEETLAGSPAQIADYLEEVFEATGERGGFMIAHPPVTPRDLASVVDYLVPELQRRGRFRTAYGSRLLKDNLAD
ncbi:methylene-tetrahydromethanopterin reductase [Chelatococcus reniformis]|uniref:Methylene-tetrahydromethanopterin reductase n=2 Tax=Chelatococcus reniformis TaxID=1494448 RepID=A0A916XNL0_9HYPH|nr:methylene-tetrahydromethanopterin reductase [Chelatococcus reniformis]